MQIIAIDFLKVNYEKTDFALHYTIIFFFNSKLLIFPRFTMLKVSKIVENIPLIFDFSGSVIDEYSSAYRKLKEIFNKVQGSGLFGICFKGLMAGVFYYH